MTHVIVKDPDGILILDCDIYADGTVHGMAKDGYDLIVDGDEVDSSIQRS